MLPSGTETRAPFLSVEGELLHLRPLEPSDRDGIADLFDRLSPQSRHRRFHGPKPTLSPRELTYLSDVDHVGHEALTLVDSRTGALLGISRYVVRREDPKVADTAIEVADDMQRVGIGTLLGRVLVERAGANGIERLEASVLWDNVPARALMRRLGFRARASRGAVVELAMELTSRRPQ